MDADVYLLLAWLPVPWTYLCTKERQILNPTEGSPYIIIKRTQLCLCTISSGPYYLQENVLYCKEIAVQLECYKGDIFLEITSIKNVDSIRIYIGTTLGYPTQFPWMENLIREILNIIPPFCNIK